MPVEKDFTRANIDFLKFRRNTHPHLYVATVNGGCRVCGQGPGALQHNSYLVSDYEELKREDEDSEGELNAERNNSKEASAGKREEGKA